MASENSSIEVDDISVETVSDEQRVIKWAQENKIADSVVERLLKDGFTSLEAVALIEQDDLSSAKYPKGQQKLVLKAAKKLCSIIYPEDGDTNGTAEIQHAIPEPSIQPNIPVMTAQAPIHLTSVGPQNSEDPFLHLLQQQFRNGQASSALGTVNSVTNTDFNNGNSFINANAADNHDSVSWKNPQVFIASAAAGKSQITHGYDIIDFVSGSIEEEVVLGGSGSQQIVVKTGPKRPKLEALTLAQWSIANLAILYKLTGEGKISGSHIMDYLSYTTKVYQLVQRYNLVSVLLFDQEYRKLQATHGFRWGTDIPHLQTVFLQARPPKPTAPTTRAGPSSRGTPGYHRGPTTTDGKEICKLFNTKSGCYYQDCKYIHQCSFPGCSEKHSAATHQAQKKLQVTPLPGLCLTAWVEELEGDPDREFLLNGIKNGFDIIDDNAHPTPVQVKNHKSVRPGSDLYDQANEQVLHELSIGNYVVVDEPPDIISPIGAIPKPDGGVRLIHDCSLPDGLSVNDYCSSDWHQKFSRVDDAASLVTKDCYMAKVDLKNAYRSVPISANSQKVTGLVWDIDGKNVFINDRKLPFGSKLAPGIFHRITQAVRRMLLRRGIKACVVYLDDFFLCASSRAECARALRILLQLLRKLGFQINWKKVVDPSRRIIFLGIEIDSETMCLRLPEEKIVQIRNTLFEFLGRKRASKRQLQSLAGKLNFAAGVVHGGRVFLRRIFNAIKLLKLGGHKIKLSSAIQNDIIWWHNFMSTFNGKSLLLDHQPIYSVFTDACNSGAAGVYGTDWIYCNWEVDWPKVSSWHINDKEILAVILVANRWAPHWENRRICIQSDNMTTVASINKGVGSVRRLCEQLDHLVAQFRTQTFAESTRQTYRSQTLLYLKFCAAMNINPVPISATNLCRYIAFIAGKLRYSSIKQYLNAVRLMHLEANHPNPLVSNWYISSLLKGVRRAKGDCNTQKLPITLPILQGILTTLNLSHSFDMTFWAACLVAFFTFFRKSNLLVPSRSSFNPKQHLTGSDVVFCPQGAVLAVRWSKTIQFRQRTLHVPIPRINGSPFCPSAALLLILHGIPDTGTSPLFQFRSQNSTVPLTHPMFVSHLRKCLSKLGYQPDSYSGHSFRRGGATFALQCGLPGELIKLQGDWVSNCYERYLEPSFPLRSKVAQTLGAEVARAYSV